MSAAGAAPGAPIRPRHWPQNNFLRQPTASFSAMSNFDPVQFFQAITGIKEVDKDQEKFIRKIFNAQPKYKIPEGYRSFRSLVVVMIARVLFATGRECVNNARNRIMDIYRLALEASAPAVFVGKDIGGAIINTTLPEVSHSLNIPLNYFHLLLPELQEIKGLTLTHLVVCAYKVDETTGATELAPLDSVLMHCLFIGWLAGKAVESMSIFVARPSGENLCFCVDDYPLEIIEAPIKLALNYLLLAEHQPELITEEAPRLPAGSGFGGWRPSENEYLPNRWLGKDYKRPTATSSGAGSHASPLAHWRRGHWHHFRCGEKRQNLRLKWVEPVFVNACP